MSERPVIKPPGNPTSDDEAIVQTNVVKLSSERPGSATSPDWVASEAPLEVRIGGVPVTVLMRTPGSDEELVRGFLYGEGVVLSLIHISEPTRLLSISYAVFCL